MPQVARRLRAVSVIFPMALGLVALVGPVSRPRPLALDSVYDVSPVTLFIPAESARQASAVLQSLRLRSPAAGDPSDDALYETKLEKLGVNVGGKPSQGGFATDGDDFVRAHPLEQSYALGPSPQREHSGNTLGGDWFGHLGDMPWTKAQIQAQARSRAGGAHTRRQQMMLAAFDPDPDAPEPSASIMERWALPPAADADADARELPAMQMRWDPASGDLFATNSKTGATTVMHTTPPANFTEHPLPRVPVPINAGDPHTYFPGHTMSPRRVRGGAPRCVWPGEEGRAGCPPGAGEGPDSVCVCACMYVCLSVCLPACLPACAPVGARAHARTSV